MIEIQKLYLLVPLAPLVGSLIAGLLGRVIGTTWSHRITIGMMFVCLAASITIFMDVSNGNIYNGSVYTWMTSGTAQFEIGFLIDKLSATMMVVVSFVSLGPYLYHRLYEGRSWLSEIF